MSKWRVHRYFSNKLSTRSDITERADRIIDLEKSERFRDSNIFCS